jgi:hypothetical protein
MRNGFRNLGQHNLESNKSVFFMALAARHSVLYFLTAHIAFAHGIAIPALCLFYGSYPVSHFCIQSMRSQLWITVTEREEGERSVNYKL